MLNTHTLAFNSCNLQIIMDFLLPVIFPDLGLSVKILCLSFSILCIIFTHILFTPYSRLWCGSTVWSIVVKNLHHKLMLSLRSDLYTQDVSLKITQNSSSKSLFHRIVGPRKQAITLNGTMSKDKTISTTGGIAPPPTDDQPHTAKDIGSSPPQKLAVSVQSSH